MSGHINNSYEKQPFDSDDDKQEGALSFSEKQHLKTVNINESKESVNETNLLDESSFKNTSRFSSCTYNTNYLNYYSTDSSDTSSDSEKCYIVDRSHLKKKKLPPIGVFWDIENCQVPKGRSAVSIARLIRDLFFTGYREAEFVVVCDVKKESSQIIQDLNDAQVTLIHVASTCKNAADEKLRQALRRFADTYSSPAAVILISGDVNFAADLSDLRHRKKLHVILIHKKNAADALILCASEHYSFTNITQSLPLKETKNTPNNAAMEVIVRNLPKSYDPVRLKNRLKQLSDNCGGRVVFVSLEFGTAVVRFINLDIAVRAQRRMDGEDVYGNKISVSYPNTIRNWDKSYSPYKLPARRVAKNPDLYMHPSYGMPPAQYPSMDYFNSISHPMPTIVQRNFLERNSTKMQQDHMQYSSGDQYNFKQQQQQNETKNMTSNVQSSRPSEGPRSIRGTHGGAPIYADMSGTGNEHWRPHSASFSDGQMRSRTPIDTTTNISKSNWCRNVSGSFTSLNTVSMETGDCEATYQPVATLLRSNSTNSNSSPGPVDLLVTNLDQTLDPQDLKSHLLSIFQEHAMVVSMSLFHQSDGNLAANVRVSSVQDSQYVISQLHRRKIGHKRILISNAQSSSTNPHVLRSQVIALLQEVPGNRMPLFKFRELLETRYRSSVSVSELYKLRDVCSVNDELGGRMIALCPDLRTTPSPHLNSQSGLETPHCMLHCPNGLGERGWAEPETPPLPNVRFKLKVFTPKVHELLHSHMGTLPLPSFPVCYEIENGEKLPIDETGVPLEHLISCVVGVELRLSSNMVKYLVWDNQVNGEDNNDDMNSASSVCGGSSVSAALKCVSPPLATQLALFSRELVDLLKTAPHCQLPFSRFIPAYHHHFGRQCRVADYGHTKLVDLFDSLSHIVQIIGEGNKRMITLSPSAQIRRFTSDLLRVLKSQASKQVILSEFGAAYERVLSRAFDPVDYGLCDLADLLEEVAENTVVIKQFGNDIIIAIPKREQTKDEMIKTKQFAVEVVDLLRHAPQYGMLFNKFVPAYHHHFGHQCRVSDYGFTKLIELFEAIPEVVKIEETSDGERRVSLTAKEALKVVCQQILQLVKSSRLQSIPLVALPTTFLREHGYPLRPDLYECSTTEDLINKISDSLHLISGPTGPMVILVEETSQHQLGIRIWALLLKAPHTLTLPNLIHSFLSKYGYPCTVQQMDKYRTILEIKNRTNGDTEISLTPRYALAARLYHLLFENGGSLLLGNVDGMYLRKYGKVLRPAEYDATTLNALLSQLAFLFVVRGRRNKRNVSLNVNIANLGIQLPANMKYQYSEAGDTNVNLNNNVQWPPPAAHTYLFNSGRTAASPPKPDTPPAHGNSLWDNSMWSPSPHFTSLNLCIPMPFVQTPPLMENPGELISPMKNLLPAYNSENHIKPPDPSELPMPNAELLNKGKTTSPGKDSGISSTSFCNSDEPDSSTNFESENTPKKKRHLRLAAHFPTPLNLS